MIVFPVIKSRPLPIGQHRPSPGSSPAGQLPGLLLQCRVRLALAALLLATFGAAVAAPGLARPLFILGSAVVGWLAWRESCARSIEAGLTLYMLAPLLRRLVDAAIGFDPAGVMLVGPVLAIAIPTVELRHLLFSRRSEDAVLLPLVLVGLCITYGMLLSAFMGEFGPLGTAALKMYAPLLFGAWVMRQARDNPAALDAATRTFFVLGPVIGAYGIWQYVSPSDWDRYWMESVAGTISVLGRPEPYGVRVFSTMNSPASFGTYAACALLLFGFCRKGWTSPLLAMMIGLGLLFTFYRTAWIAVVLGVAYCALFGRTRERAGMIAVMMVVAVILAAGSADFGAAIIDRLETFTGSLSDDGSGKARLSQLFEAYRMVDQMAFGFGFSRLSTPFNGVDAADGEVVTAIITMGVVVGSVYIVALVWAALQALSRLRGSKDPRLIVTGAVIVGMMASIPLTSVTSGEIGLLLCCSSRWRPRTGRALALANRENRVEICRRAIGSGRASRADCQFIDT